jgi:acyl-CoA reductase-like NAD-dependent aldehyde dehydrogenase
MPAESPTLDDLDFFAGGSSVKPRAGGRFESVDPATGHAWASVAAADDDDVDDVVQIARQCFEGAAWRALAASDRGLLLFRLADAIAADADRIGMLETRDNGKLLKEMQVQLQLVPKWLRYFAGMADKVQGATIPLDRLSVLNYTLPEPLGVVAIITPWNSPVFLTMMAAAPALAAGNTVVVKPSEITSASMLAVAQLAHEVGFPPGALNVLTGLLPASQALVRHPDVAKISLTGGVEAGRAVGIEAAKRFVPVTLELGGKSANIVFGDADLDAAEAGLLAGIFAAAGQTCVAGSRAFVHEDVYETVLERLRRRAVEIVVGDPMDDATQMGPIATQAQLDKVAGFVERARSEGGEVVAGGEPATVDGRPDGFFYRPTIVGGASDDGHLAQHEVFGPILAVFPFRDEDEVLARANATRFGLAAGVWTRDVQRAHRMARDLQAGTVWLNMYRSMAPQSPFGGYKDSGIGRQNGLHAIDEYLQTKSVWVELSDEVQDPFVLRA